MSDEREEGGTEDGPGRDKWVIVAMIVATIVLAAVYWPR